MKRKHTANMLAGKVEKLVLNTSTRELAYIARDEYSIETLNAPTLAQAIQMAERLASIESIPLEIKS